MRFIQPKALATLCIVAIVAVSGQYIALASETNYYEGWTGTEDEMECL